MRRSREKYYECPYCHNNLDYGEKCHCQEEKERDDEERARMYAWDDHGQLTLRQAAGV